MFHTLKHIREWTIGAKITLLVFIVVSMVLLSFIAMINANITKHAKEQAEVEITAKTRILVDMLDVYDNELRTEVKVLTQTLQSSFKDPIELTPSRSIDINGNATPVLTSGTTELNLNYAVTDFFTRQTGAIATIFVKKGNDFIRISTSLKKENGDRAVGTPLDHANPAYQALQDNLTYIGNATLFSKQYVTEYLPLHDTTGKTIGALFAGMEFTSAIKQIKDDIRAIKIGQSGYFYVLDSTEGSNYGNLIIHPIKEGQNIYESKDQAGHEFIKEIMQRKQGFSHTELGETEPREKIVAFFPMKHWNWILVGGLYQDEYTSDTDKLTLRYQIIGVILLIFIGSALYWVMYNKLSIPLKNAITAAKKLASGDLTTYVNVTSVDEIGQLMSAINGIGHGLADVVNNVRESTSLIVQSSQDIAQGNANLSARTETQTSSLEQTTASMQVLTDTVQENSKNAHQANHLVVSASDVAIQGGQIVNQVIDTMTSIKESSTQIVNIISVIDSIAFQTNILALNAAVEAARAGEQGRGFAVVASEVRNLAQRSASAAKEIKTLISDSVTKVDAGNLLAEKTGKTMRDIVSSVEKVTSIMSEIMNASEEQSSGIEQVNLAVAQIDEITHQNAILAEQAAAAATSMNDQAETLVQAVSAFKTTEAHHHQLNTLPQVNHS